MRYTCPCCGYKTLAEPGGYGLCTICWWEDDPAQSENPDLEGGANRPSLRQAQLDFIVHGAADPRDVQRTSAPAPWVEHDPGWLPLHQPPENIEHLQKEIRRRKELPLKLFKAAAFMFFKEQVRRYARIRRDIERIQSERIEKCERKKTQALKRVKDERKRHWISKAELASEVDFILKARRRFWEWIDRVTRCDHLHLELITESNYFIPLYSCRYCGAYVGCSCFGVSWEKSDNKYGMLRPTALNEFIPFALFSEVFFQPGICYRCRKDAELSAARHYGKDEIERYLWRELFLEESRASTALSSEFQTVDEIIGYSMKRQPRSTLIHVIMESDTDNIIRSMLEHALYVKKRLQAAGGSTSIKDILRYVVDLGCRTYQNIYGIDEKDFISPGELLDFSKIPLAVHLPWSSASHAMRQELGLIDNPEKAAEMPLMFKLSMLGNFLLEGRYATKEEVRKMAKASVKVVEFDPKGDLERAILAAERRDIYLFLKLVQKVWRKDRNLLEANRDDLARAIVENGIEWAVLEYSFYCKGGYSGFEFGLNQDRKLLAWLETLAPIPEIEPLLEEGKILTNVVGMYHIDWGKYLELDDYLHGGDEVRLIRERTNPHDPNAIRVSLKGFGKLGYIKRSVAGCIAPLMRKNTSLKGVIYSRQYANSEIDTTLFLEIVSVP